MGKLGGFLSRKPVPSNAGPAPRPAPENPLELDEELFSALGARVGGENEALRNLLLNASAKINELDAIKDAVNQLADPVGKALAAYEAEKSEKVGLQALLNNTRTAFGKLRNEMADLEKRHAATQSECLLLRQELIGAQDLLKSTEATKKEISIDVAARRAQIAELESRLSQSEGDKQALSDENRRLDDRLIGSEKRLVVLESDLNSTRQRLLVTEDERRTLQESLDKTISDAARTQRKLAEAETSLTTVHGRLRHVEGNFAEVAAERARLANALEEAHERHEHERNSQRIRIDALQARVGATEKLLGEAREHMLARADEIRDYDRRLGETALSRDTIQAHIAEFEADKFKRESEYEELRQAHNTLKDRSAALARAYNAKDVDVTRALETNAALGERIEALENEIKIREQTAEKAIEELATALRREKHERAVAEGALDTGRKDFARLMREVMTLQRERTAQEPGPNPFAANAA
jgi:chromosome segregation ATPase